MNFKDISLDAWKVIFGFGLLIVITVLALVIALGHVTQESSFGLDIVLGSLATIGGMFGNWCFGSQKREPTNSNEKTTN